MANATTTPASVAARLTDEWIETIASNFDSEGYFYIAAVLRDYVRMRKMVNAVKEKVSECNMLGSYDELKYEGELPHTSKILKSVEDIKRLLAEAEKGEMK